MSLTAFQKYRRIKQVEEMKPENIKNSGTISESLPTISAEEDTTEKNSDTIKSRRSRRHNN